MNIQNKLYAIQFLLTARRPIAQPVPKQRSWHTELADFTNFTELPKKDWTHGEVWAPRKKGIKRGFLRPGQPSFINWAGRLWYGIFPRATLGWLPGCAPSQLLHTCSAA